MVYLPNDEEAKQTYVHNTVRNFIDKHVMNQMPQQESAELSTNMICRYCGKRYVRQGYLQRHEQKEHGHVDEAAKSTGPTIEQDHIYNYTRQMLVLLLMRLSHNNAISLGDGGRVIHIYKFFYLFFKISKCPKYVFATLELIAQINYLLSPRLSYSLMWNRFVNHKGYLESNHPMNLDVEHDNKAFKTDIHSFRGDITDRTISRVSQSIEVSNAILECYDKSTHVRKPSGKHPKISNEDDVKILIEEFQQAEVYKCIPGRSHRSFPNMKANLLDELNIGKFQLWVKNSMKKLCEKNYYK